MKKEYDRSLTAILVLTAIFAAFFFYYSGKSNQQIILLQKEEERKTQILDSLELEAKAVSVYDITESKQIYGRNEDIPLPIASLAKIMTISVALGEKKENDKIYVSPSAISQNGDFGLFAREEWKVGDLAKLTLISSANDGAFALASDNFLSKMNGKGKRIGMKNTLFLNYTGLDMKGQAGAFASAKDINLLSVFAMNSRPEIFGSTVVSEITLQSESGFIHEVKNTNTEIDNIPGVLFSKTGYTELAGGNLSVIFKDKKRHDIAVTVLGSSYSGRFTDMEKIVQTLYSFDKEVFQ